jgi:hypothetical protein
MFFDKVIFDKVIVDKVIVDKVIVDKVIFDKASNPRLFELSFQFIDQKSIAGRRVINFCRLQFLCQEFSICHSTKSQQYLKNLKRILTEQFNEQKMEETISFTKISKLR